MLAVLLFFTLISYSCNNSADTSKAGTDTSKMSAQPDTTKKVDTTKMDTATTRPVKSPN